MEKSYKFLQKAFNLRPNQAKIIEDFAENLLMRKEYDRVLQIVENIKDNPKHKFTYLLIKGTAIFYKKDYIQAIEILEKANEIFDSDIRVLNALGHAYLRSGDREQAQKVFTASLKVNENQKTIAETLKGIKD